MGSEHLKKPPSRQDGSRIRAISLIALGVALLLLDATAFRAQTVTPSGIRVTPASPVCTTSGDFNVQIKLPPASVVDKVDVFFLFDDTGSFSGFVPQVSSIFSGLVTNLETALPGVDFGFGVGRFEDYGGPAVGFSAESTTGRPFILNQPIVTVATAGGLSARNDLITSALSRTAPGYGGDTPESDFEALFQVATGAGFDGNGNGSLLDSGVAGAAAPQTNPGDSGDVPPFSSNVLPASGTLGGVGFRSGALHLVLLATDTCPIAAFPAGAAIPATITGAGGSSVPTTAFACASAPSTFDRFGYVGDSISAGSNTVAGAVTPSVAATVQGTVNLLNSLGIRVLGMGPYVTPTASTSPGYYPDVWLSAMARLTGAVDSGGNALVFSTDVPLTNLTTSISNAIAATTTLPVDIALGSSSLPTGLAFDFAPGKVPDVAPDGTASFVATLAGGGFPVVGDFDINFVDTGSGAVLGSIPVSVSCKVTKINAGLDIKPQGCPNPINVGSQGVLPVAILGSSTFDVTKIDLSTIKVEGVSPLRSVIADVGTPSTPLTGKETVSDCNAAGPDGYKDLNLKFDTQSIVQALGAVSDGDVRVLKLTGNLIASVGGTAIEGEDVVLILKKKTIK